MTSAHIYVDKADDEAGRAWWDEYARTKHALDGDAWVKLVSEDCEFDFGPYVHAKDREELRQKVNWMLAAMSELKYHDTEVTVLADKTLIETGARFTFKAKEVEPEDVKLFLVMHKAPKDKECTKGWVHGQVSELIEKVKSVHAQTGDGA